MRLLDVKSGIRVRLVSYGGGRGVESKLRQLGVSPGDILEIAREAPLGGPILVNVNGRSVALGRGVASKILVEEI